MAKLKTVYVCSECGGQQSKWAGSCGGCQAWNSLVEDVIDVAVQKSAKHNGVRASAQVTVRKLSEVTSDSVKRFKTNIAEFDRVLGGGIVPGSLTLLAGEPGIGKSTLMLQILAAFKSLGSVLYVAGEESVEQISLRSARIKVELNNVDFVGNTEVDAVLSYLEDNLVDLVIVDSVSVLYSPELGSFAGSVPQVRFVTERFMEYAKRKQVPVILIGHVTKQGNIAGPRVMEHLVDVVLQLEGDRHEQVRLLRALKNRFGSTQEVGMFAMEGEGLQEVVNPGEALLSERGDGVIGSALTVTLDGRRPFVVEVQALVSRSYFGYPKRSANGFDGSRLDIILAVLEKYHGLKLGEFDVFVNVVGGVRIKEPGCDLAVLEAIKSSYTKTPLPGKAVYTGEVGLDGKVREPMFKQLREREWSRLK